MQLITFQRLKITDVRIPPQCDASDNTLTFGTALLSPRCMVWSVGEGGLPEASVCSNFWQLFVIFVALINQEQPC